MWNIDGTGGGDGVDPQKLQHKYGSRDGINPPHNLMSNMGLKQEMEWTLKRYNTNLELELALDLELTPYVLRWDIDGTGDGDGQDP